MTGGGRPLEAIWYGRSPWRFPLLPLSALFGVVSRLRRILYRNRIFSTPELGHPVIVVGNITAGGTGKTPVALWLAEQLKERGRRPGIVSRGYGGRPGPHPVHVTIDSDPGVVGDEPLLMESRRVCPVVVHPDRVAAARLLMDMECDVIIADDGLQHYRLQRQYEVAVVDGARGFGNGHLLPAGPLRESRSRLSTVDRIFVQREAGRQPGASLDLPASVPATAFELKAGPVRNVRDERETSLADFRGRSVHAVAGIGHPGRFFRLLEAHGISVIRHPHPDHASLTRQDLTFRDELSILMTEKDAVRCRHLAGPDCWFVAVTVEFSDASATGWLDRICQEMNERGARQVP